MERIDINEDFKEWLILHLPLYIILDMWGDYSALPKPKGEITEAEIKAFENYLKKHL